MNSYSTFFYNSLEQNLNDFIYIEDTLQNEIEVEIYDNIDDDTEDEEEGCWIIIFFIDFPSVIFACLHISTWYVYFGY